MHQIEQALFASWPALEEENYCNWRLRFANGYTKRANSANALNTIDHLSTSHIEYIENFFQMRNIPTTFRLASFCTSTTIDDILENKGYQSIDLSYVMTSPVDGIIPSNKTKIISNASQWLNLFKEISGENGNRQNTHLTMLEKIRHPCAYAILQEGEQAVCCGLGVVYQRFIGIYDVATRPNFRGKGFAQQLCFDLMAWGQNNGAQTAYLQVLSTNIAALKLYENLGFSHCYDYWYRIQSIQQEVQ